MWSVQPVIGPQKMVATITIILVIAGLKTLVNFMKSEKTWLYCSICWGLLYVLHLGKMWEENENILIFPNWSLIIISSHWVYNLINGEAGKANRQACSSPFFFFFFADLSVSSLMRNCGDRSRQEEREGHIVLFYTHPVESAGKDSTDNDADTISVQWAPVKGQTWGWVLSSHILSLSSHNTLSKCGVITFTWH